MTIQIDSEQELSIFVRPTPWGNPFPVENEYPLSESLRLYEAWLRDRMIENPGFLDELRGKDLCCWCSISSACHADILIEYITGIKTWPVAQDDNTRREGKTLQ